MIRHRLPLLQEKLPLKEMVLFGSYAKGRQTIASDVDLLVVYKGKHREDAYKLVRQTLKIPRLEPHVYSEEEHGQIKSTIERMTREGIPIF